MSSSAFSGAIDVAARLMLKVVSSAGGAHGKRNRKLLPALVVVGLAILVGTLSSTDMGRTACWTVARPIVTPASGTPSRPSHGIQVIGAGPGRTGTVSLGVALKKLGFRPYHMKDVFIHGHADLWQNALDTGSIAQVANVLMDLGYDAILDEPVTEFVPQLAQFFPQAKIVLTGRDQDKWIHSLHKLADMHEEFSRAPYSLINHLRQFSSLARRILRKRGCYFPSATEADPSQCLAWYHRHEMTIQNLPMDVLEYRVDEGWEPLQLFLNRTHTASSPETSFPRVNGSHEVKLIVSLLRFGRYLFYVIVAYFVLAQLPLKPFLLRLMLGDTSKYDSKKTRTASSTTSSGEVVVRIRGMSSAIPGVDGMGGLLVPTRAICHGLRDWGIHNPATGKPIKDDFAERHLHMTSVAYGCIDMIEEHVGAENAYYDIPKDCGNSTEEDLRYKAFDDAMKSANTKVEDLDALIYVSCTEDDIYFNENMRAWYKKYPDLSRRLIPLCLPYGCPALIFALKLGNRLLQGRDIENVAIVISNSTSKGFTKAAKKAYTRGNDIRLWLNSCVFGDAAFSCILSTSTENMPSQSYKLVLADIVADPDVFISGRSSIIVNVDDLEEQDEKQRALSQAKKTAQRKQQELRKKELEVIVAEAKRKGKKPPSEILQESMELYSAMTSDANDEKTGESVPVYWLNPLGPQEIPASLKYWFGLLQSNYGYTLESFQHIVFHQANPKVINDVCTRFGCLDKTSVVGEKYGNVASASIGCALHDRLEKNKKPPANGDLVLGYALGGQTGNSHGVFVLECEVSSRN